MIHLDFPIAILRCDWPGCAAETATDAKGLHGLEAAGWVIERSGIVRCPRHRRSWLAWRALGVLRLMLRWARRW